MIVDIRLALADGSSKDVLQKAVDEIVNDKLEKMDQIRLDLVSGLLQVY